MFRKILISLCLAASVVSAYRTQACTAVIVSGKKTLSGRPLLVKVRDYKSVSDIKYFHGPVYDFIGQSPTVKSVNEIRSVVSGCNTEGLCLASLTPGKGFPMDTVKIGRVSGGTLLFKALGRCRDLREFEEFVAQLMERSVCITHVAAIDARGHAACYEFIGKSYVKYDADDPEAAPNGFRVMTNFTFAGDPKLGGGQVRYRSAVEIMNSLPLTDGKFDLDAVQLMDAVTRTFRHSDRKIENIGQIRSQKYFPGKDFITRNTTNTISAFEGVLPSESPSRTIMWVNSATPVCTPSIPLFVCSGYIPDFMTGENRNPAPIVDRAMDIRNRLVYDRNGEGRFKWFNVGNTVRLIDEMRKVESQISKSISSPLGKWRKGTMSDEKFYSEMQRLYPKWYTLYLKAVKD